MFKFVTQLIKFNLLCLLMLLAATCYACCCFPPLYCNKNVPPHRYDPGGVPAGAAHYDGWQVYRRRRGRALPRGAHRQEGQLQLCSIHAYTKAWCKGQRRLVAEEALDKVYSVYLVYLWVSTYSYIMLIGSWQASPWYSSPKVICSSCLLDPLLQLLNPTLKAHLHICENTTLGSV